MRERTPRDREAGIAAFASQAEAPRSPEVAPQPESPRDRLEARLNSGRRYNIQNVLGNDSVKRLIDHAVRQEESRPQDIIRKYLLLALEEKYGDDVPIQ